MGDSCEEYSRRKFLAASGMLAAGVAVASCASTAVHRVSVREGRIEVDRMAHPALSQVGGGILLQAPELDGPVFLVHLGEDRFRALQAVCTHLGCTVRYGGGFLQCPCHGSTFTLEGQPQRGPAQRPLPTYRVELSGNTVRIFVRP